MTGKERFLQVLNGGEPDRVPVTLFIQDMGHFLNQMYPDIGPWEFERLQLKVIELQRQLGVDVFVRLLFCTDDSFHWLIGGVDIDHQTDEWQIDTQTIRKDALTTIKRTTIATPGGILTQELSFYEQPKGTVMFACTEKPIKSPADLELAVRYEPRMPADWPHRAAGRISRIKEALGDDGIVGTWSPYGPFNMVSLLIDHSELYSLFLTDTEYYERLMEFAIVRSTDYLRAIDAAGPDVHCIGGNVPGGGFILQSADFLEYGTPLENIEAYVDTALQHADY